MPIEHEQVCMWTLSADRRSVRMTLPPLPVNGLSEPIAVKIDFGAERGILRDVPRRRRSQSDLLTSWATPISALSESPAASVRASPCRHRCRASGPSAAAPNRTHSIERGPGPCPLGNVHECPFERRVPDAQRLKGPMRCRRSAEGRVLRKYAQSSPPRPAKAPTHFHGRFSVHPDGRRELTAQPGAASVGAGWACGRGWGLETVRRSRAATPASKARRPSAVGAWRRATWFRACDRRCQ